MRSPCGALGSDRRARRSGSILCAMRLLFCLALLLASGASGAQPLPLPDADTTATRFGTSTAVVIRLDEYGFGLGGATRGRLTDDLSITFEAGVGSGKDTREQQFFFGSFGDSVTPFKRNYALLVPLHLGLEQRLFRQSVEDNFRPFVTASGGPVMAFQWPYFDDIDSNGIRDDASGEDILGALSGIPDGQIRVGLSGNTAVGAYFGSGTRRAQGLRFGFIAHYFPGEVDLLELRPEVEDPSRQWFITPVVSFHLVRLIGGS